MKTGYFIYYTEASIVCVIIFGIMLLRDVFSVDRQEKQIKYDHALIAYMLYFCSDAIWAAIIAGKLPRNTLTVVASNFSNYILMAVITYTWLRYVMAFEQVPFRETRVCKTAILSPFILATVALIATYLSAPHALLNDALELQPAYNVFLIAVPCIYIMAVLVFTLKRAHIEESPIERRKHLSIGFFPMTVIIGGLLQVIVLTETPVFCFCCAIMMLVFYLNDMETKISTDPLTALNNRSQLLHYTSLKANIRREGRHTFVVMFDINDFKVINDTFGHAEGDRALVLVADALKCVVKNHGTPMFLARFGGDEFILIVHPLDANGIEPLIEEIRGKIEAQCRAEATPYLLSIGAGFDELAGDGDTFQKCMQRADERLYLNKADMKARGMNTVRLK